jgi:uncharacterized protein (DUF433 family)
MIKRELVEKLQDDLIVMLTDYYNAGLTHNEVMQALQYAQQHVSEAAKEDENDHA